MSSPNLSFDIPLHYRLGKSIRLKFIGSSRTELIAISKIERSANPLTSRQRNFETPALLESGELRDQSSWEGAHHATREIDCGRLWGVAVRSAQDSIRSFKVNVPEESLADLRRRIAATR